MGNEAGRQELLGSILAKGHLATMRILVLDGDDVQVYANKDDAEEFIETYDATDPRLIFCTSQGLRLAPTIDDDHTKLTEAERDTGNEFMQYLKKVLRNYIADWNLEYDGDPEDTTSLTEFIWTHENYLPKE